MDKTRVPIGPQHPLLKEPLTVNLEIAGENVLGGSLNIGYVHRGIERLAQSRNYIQNVHLVERVCGICSHIHTTTYCFAVERLLGIQAPPRALYIRALMCELERIQSHLLWLGVLAKHVGLDTIFMHTWHDRELVLDVMESLSGGRVSHAVNKIGGVRKDLQADFRPLIDAMLKQLTIEVEKVLRVLQLDATIQARTQGVAVISAKTIKAYGAVGPTARASGVDIDLRRDDPLPPYDKLHFSVITHPDGDAWARTILRIKETHESLLLIDEIMQTMPDGAVEVRTPRKVPAGEALVRAEAPRGEVLYYLRSDGTEYPARLKIRTPSLPALALLPVQLNQIQVADIPVVLAGVDLCIACADR